MPFGFQSFVPEKPLSDCQAVEICLEAETRTDLVSALDMTKSKKVARKYGFLLLYMIVKEG